MVVAYDVEGAGWRLSVSDNGVGRPNDSGVRGRGGLGTSIIEALADQLDARVMISSGSKGGTVVSVAHAM